MAVAKKCDRCGELYEYYGRENVDDYKNKQNSVMICNIDESGDKYYNNGLKDLCPNCLRSFKTWWDDHKHTKATVDSIIKESKELEDTDK